MLFAYHTEFLYKLGFILLRWFRASAHTQSCLLHFPKAPDGFSALFLNPDTLEPSPFPSSSRPASSAALRWGPLGQAHRAGLTLHRCSRPPPLPGCAWLLRGQGQTHPPTPTPLYTPAPTHTHTHTHTQASSTTVHRAGDHESQAAAHQDPAAVYAPG